MQLFGKVLQRVGVLRLGLLLDGGTASAIQRLAVWTVLNLTILSLIFGILILLEVLFSHLPLNNHQASVDETFFE